MLLGWTLFFAAPGVEPDAVGEEGDGPGVGEAVGVGEFPDVLVGEAVGVDTGGGGVRGDGGAAVDEFDGADDDAATELAVLF